MNLAGATLAIAVIALALATSALIGVFRLTRHPVPKKVRKLPPPDPATRVGGSRLTPEDTIIMGKRPTPRVPSTTVAVRRHQPITNTGRHRRPDLFTHPDQLSKGSQQ